MTRSKFEKLAFEIIDWCKERELWGDSSIYFNGKALSTWNNWEGEEGSKIAEDVYEYTDKNPLYYFQYAKPETLSMSFEGPLYMILNAYWENKTWLSWYEEFNALFERHGYYFEQGSAWNLSVCED